MVDRYEPTIIDRGSHYHADMESVADGDYVLATDYAALEAERDTLRRKLDAVMEAYSNAPDYDYSYDRWNDGYDHAMDEIRAIVEGE